MRYPSSPFKRTRSKLDSMNSKASKSANLTKLAEENVNSNKQDDSSEYTTSEDVAVVKLPKLNLTALELSRIPGDTDSSIDDTTSQEGSTNRDKYVGKDENGDISKLAVIREKVVFSEETALSPMDAFVDTMANDILKDAVEEASILEKFKNKTDEEVLALLNNKEIKEEKLEKAQSVSNSSMHDSVFSRPKIEKNIVPSLKRSYSVPREVGSVRIMTPRSLEASIIQQQIGLTRSISDQVSRKSASDMRYHLFGGATTVSTPDFFSRGGTSP